MKLGEKSKGDAVPQTGLLTNRLGHICLQVSKWASSVQVTGDHGNLIMTRTISSHGGFRWSIVYLFPTTTDQPALEHTHFSIATRARQMVTFWSCDRGLREMFDLQHVTTLAVCRCYTSFAYRFQGVSLKNIWNGQSCSLTPAREDKDVHIQRT